MRTRRTLAPKTDTHGRNGTRRDRGPHKPAKFWIGPGIAGGPSLAGFLENLLNAPTGDPREFRNPRSRPTQHRDVDDRFGAIRLPVQRLIPGRRMLATSL